MGETNGDNKKKTAREIIENYNGPKVRIMEVCGIKYVQHHHLLKRYENINHSRSNKQVGSF